MSDLEPVPVYPAVVSSIGPPTRAVGRLPGEGEAKQTCGAILRGVQCGRARQEGGERQSRLVEGGKHVQKVVVARCWRPSCPLCYGAWAARKGNESEEQLRAAMNLYARDGRPLGPARHFVFSPPQDRAKVAVARGKDGVRDLLKELYRLMAKGGLTGGLVVYHEWRTTARGDGKYRKGENFLAPHFHVVAFGRMVNAAEFHKTSGGWLYKNKDAKGERRNLAATVTYLLDHAAVVDGLKTIRWFGLLSNRKMLVAGESKSEEVMRCECGDVCYECPLDPRTGDPDWTAPAGVFYVKVRKRVFALREAPGKVSVVRGLDASDMTDT